MPSSDLSLFSDAYCLPEQTAQFDIAMQVVMQDGPQHRRPIRERLTAVLPGLSAHATESLLTVCRAVVRQAHALSERVKSRVLTRREASLALYDQFPGLTRLTAERMIGQTLGR